MSLRFCHIIYYQWKVVGVNRASTGTRARASRRARAARAPVEARRQARQLKVEAALAAYYAAAEQAARVRDAAGARASKIVTQAEATAREHDAEAAHAVLQMRDLGEVNAEIARLCGISVAALRKLVALARPSGDGVDPGHDARAVSVTRVSGTGPGP